MRDIIEQTAQKIPNYDYDSIAINGTWDIFTGYGLLDAHRAVLKAAYHKVYGDTALTMCDTGCHAYTVRAPHNANIDSMSFFWTSSDNLQMVAGQNSDSVWVRFANNGIGQLQCHIIHDGDTVTSSIEISNMSGWNMYDNISIDNSITFPDTFVLSREVSVDSLTTLNWQNKTVFCTPDCRLIVRPGGKLIVDGGTLTSACPGEMWQGIEVVGDRTKRQLAQYQGTVELRNGAVIENAMCGIRTGLREDTVTFATAGGIISAENATFRNNRQAVVVNSYAYAMPNGSILVYHATFDRCTFTVDSNNLFAANNTSFAEHVRLWDVRGIAFTGCAFNNLTSNMLENGRGIYAAEAGLEVNTYCTRLLYDNECECPDNLSTYSSFSGFNTAVEVVAGGNPYAVVADRVRFENNITGIRINANNFATVTRCDFDLQQIPTYSAYNCGLFLDNCSGYNVEGNRFHKASKNLHLTSTGIKVNNTGSSINNIYKTFSTRWIMVLWCRRATRDSS